MSTEINDRVLEAWARRDATRSIMEQCGIPTVRAFHKIIERARDLHDPRAIYRKGREKTGRPSQEKQESTIEGGHVNGWWFDKEVIMVRRLGLGSVDCELVPVSVSCIPSGGFDRHDWTRVSRPTRSPRPRVVKGDDRER